MAISTFARRFAPFSKGAAAAGVFGIAGASLFAATPAMAADYECEVFDGLPAPTLVGADVCQIVITHADTPEPTSFTFPAAMGKVQAVVVGAGGGGAAFAEFDGYDYGAYGGGGGQVAFVDEVALDTEIVVYVGQGGDGALGDYAGDGDPAIFDYASSDPVIAIGGYGATPFGGGDTDPMFDNDANTWVGGTFGDWDTFNLDNADYWIYNLGGGAGAAGDAAGEDPGAGFVLSDLVAEFGADADLFPAEADDATYGMGGTGYVEFTDVPAVSSFESIDSAADVAPANTGQGGDGNFMAYDPSSADGDAYLYGYDAADGADGAIILRYGAAVLAATGVDATAALAAGGVAAAAGAALVGAAAFRRRATH